MSRAVECALALAWAGYAVLPVLANKAPACLHGYRDATSDPDAVARLFADHPAPLVGIATGAPSGVAAVDIDPPGFGWLDANAHRLPDTVRVRTRRGGFHYWFAVADDLPSSTAGRIAVGVDTRGRGGYCVAWDAAALVSGRSRMATWPAWLSDALRPPRASVIPLRPIVACRDGDNARRYAVAALRHAVERIAAAREGARNATLNREAYSLARFLGAGITSNELAAALTVAAQVAGLPEREARGTIASALRGRAQS